MGEINQPATKELLWHKMRSDLASLVPWFSDNDLLLCPTCCRRLRYEDFSVEHIIPKQALSDDPADARDAVPRNERSGLTLLCSAPIIRNDRVISGKGCNSWKGKHYDSFLRELIKTGIVTSGINSRHHIALFSAGYLGLFREHGYQIALSQAGLLMRRQFFHPNKFLKEIPVDCQIFLMGSPHTSYGLNSHKYYSVPFSINTGRRNAVVSLRHFALPLPLSRDPNVPLARALEYAPSRYRFRPDLTTAFD